MMFLIYFLVALQMLSPSVYAGGAESINNPNICLENCRQKAKELPTCRDPECKKQNYAEIQKCEADCKAKETPASLELTLPPCILKCKNEDEVKRMECGFIDQACLQNAEMQAQMCVQNCQMQQAAASKTPAAAN